MKLLSSIQTKQTIRLFNSRYKYKIVLLSRAASWFRGNDLNNVKKNLASAKSYVGSQKLTASDLLYAQKLLISFSTMNDFIIRVESPYINFYTNNNSDVEKLAKIDSEHVKYVCLPAPGSESLLDDKKVLVKNLDYAYKINMSRTRSNHSNFVTWCADKTDRIRLTKTAKRNLSRDGAWGGYYFYVRDDKTLTMVKMFLGEGIGNIESVVKA